jgi:DNA-binding transcriptional MocR family regulator
MSRATKPTYEPAYAGRVDKMKASEIRELLKLLEQPGIISFAGGIPDPTLFPIAEAQAAYAEVLADPKLGPQSLQYSVSEGYLPLRQWIVQHMATRGVTCTPDNIVITSGSQQGLEFLGRLLLSPNDTALVEAPTYLGALQAFSAYEPRYDELRPEHGNRTPEAYVASAKAAGGRVKFAYVVPDFANPTGLTLSLAARQNVLTLARDLDIPVLEDTAYAALRFEGEAMPSLQARDIQHTGSIDASRVIYCGTFSKTITPGLRIGWLCASRDVIRRVVLVKQASDLNSALINQVVMCRLAEQIYDRQVASAIVRYRGRRDAMLRALETYMLKGVTWTKPNGGLFVWVTLPDDVDAAALLKRAVAEANVAFVPGSAFFAGPQGRNTMRLSYSLPDEAAITVGVQRLADLLAV